MMSIKREDMMSIKGDEIWFIFVLVPKKDARSSTLNFHLKSKLSNIFIPKSKICTCF